MDQWTHHDVVTLCDNLCMRLRDLQTAALQLSFAERSELAEALLNMEQPTAAELEPMWESEINQQIEATERGELKLVSGQEAFARANAALRGWFVPKFQDQFFRKCARGVHHH